MFTKGCIVGDTQGMALPIAPSATLYLQNLNDSIAVSELRRELYCLFSSVAPVVEIAARRGARTRGQAWISYARIEAATMAMQRFQGFAFLGKPLRIEFAVSESRSVGQRFDAAEERARMSEQIAREGAPRRR